MRRGIAAVLPLVVVAVLLAWAADAGGSTIAWYPTSLVVAAAAALAAAVSPVRWPRAVVLGWFALVLYAAYSAASILWTGDRAAAWDSANAVLVYALSFAVAALASRWFAGPTFVLGAAAVGVASLGVVVVAGAAGAADPSGFLALRRFAAPIGYPNATAALYFSALFVALVLGTRRSTGIAPRALLLGAAAVLLGLGAMPQSRASVVALVATYLLTLAVARDRLRLLLGTAIVVVAVAPGVSAFFSVDAYDVGSESVFRDSVGSARNALLGALSTAAALGALWAWADGRSTVPAHVSRTVSRVLAAATFGAVVVAVAVAAVAGSPLTRVEAAWDDFTGTPVGIEDERPSSHFGASLAGGNRYDIWRVAVHQFVDSPLLGAGAGNFEDDYLRERRSIDEPQHAHGLAFRALGQTGAVGFALLGTFFVLAAVAALRGVRVPEPNLAAAALAGLAGFTYWFLHALTDWLWEVPAVAGLAVVFLGLAAGAGAGQAPDARRSRVVPAMLAVASVVTVASLLSPWLAERRIDAGTSAWRSTPERSLAELERAGTLNPLSERPYVLAGMIAARTDRAAQAEAAFREALRRRETSWYSHLELGVLYATRGQPESARRELARALELNPRDQIAREVARAIGAGEELDYEDFDGLWERQLRRLARS